MTLWRFHKALEVLPCSDHSIVGFVGRFGLITLHDGCMLRLGIGH